MLSSHTVGFQRPDNSNLANLTPGLCSSCYYTHNLMHVLCSVCPVFIDNDGEPYESYLCNDVAVMNHCAHMECCNTQ